MTLALRAATPVARPWTWAWLALVAIAAALMAFAEPSSPLLAYPKAWELPLRVWVSDGMKWLINSFDLGPFTFKELTRGVAWLLDWPLAAARGLLVDGFSFSSDPKAPALLPALSWLGVTALIAAVAWRVAGGRLAAGVGACFLYIAVFGWWPSAMVTLASTAIAVAFGIAGGLALGILGHRHRWFARAMVPVLDLMQTVPVFAYLVPVLFLFGFGPVAAMIATIIYAMPPMVRVTMLALDQVAHETVEFGRMAGCSRRQMTWKVLVPSASAGLMVGVNQVIMLSLNMVIIASMIGAGGLGFDVLDSLKRLDVGKGLEAGIAITLLAIALDRLSQAVALRAPPTHGVDPGRRRWLVVALAMVIVPTMLGGAVPALAAYPEDWALTTGPLLAQAVAWINVHFFDALEAAKTALIAGVLAPIKGALGALPWPAVVAAVALGGYRLGGARLAALAAILVAFIAVTGNWEKAAITVYLVGVSVVVAGAIGLPIGIWAADRPRANRVVQAVIDTLQTLPSFVYLIPVVMLFRVGEFSAIIAVIAFAVAPAVRYVVLGLGQVPPSLIEAARAAGCSRGQILRKVRLPLAFPEIMLGLNQTVMMALSMVVITALVGTRDLGQEVYIALAKADTGRGLVSGVCVAFIAIVIDRLVGAWATRRKRELGLAP
jgi:glycine betaine/proline transport system permease protein